MKRINHKLKGEAVGEIFGLLIPTTIVVCLVVCGIVYYIGRGISYSYKYCFDRKTLDTERVLEKSVQTFKTSGIFTPTKDAWGRDIAISVQTSKLRGGAQLKESATFVSMGKDGKFSTKDDITSNESFYVKDNPEYKKPLSEKAGEATTKAAKSFFRGVFNVVKESN